MKKAILILVAIAVAVAILCLILLPKAGVNDGAELVPASTVAYVTLPDLKRTADRWPHTALAQILAEPQVSEFLAKPSSRVLSSEGGVEAAQILLNLKPGRFFFAVTDVRTGESEGIDAILGFRYFGGRKDLDSAMARFHAELQKRFPDGKLTTSQYEGETITAFELDKFTVFTGAHAPWGFVTTSDATLKEAMDRAAGRNKEAALAGVESFSKVSSHLPSEPDFFWFVQPQPIFELMVAIGKEANEALNEDQAEEIRKIQAVGGSLKLDGALQRETTFALVSNPPDTGSLDHSMIKLTSPETTVFYNGVIDWKKLSSEDNLSSIPDEAKARLSELGVDLAALSEVFGNELGFYLNWRPDAMVPGVMVALPVKDRAKAENTLNSLSQTFGLQTSESDVNGARVIEFPGARLQLVDPCVAISDSLFLGSLTSGDIEQALNRKPDAPTLESSESFAEAKPMWNETQQAFGYVDAKGLFERVYNQLRPIIIFSSAMMPGVSDFIDISKLPETEAISSHLQPIVSIQRRLDDGYLIESSGPITMTQAFALVGAGAAAVISSQKAGQQGP